MRQVERDNLNASVNGGRTYTIPSVNPKVIQRGALKLVGSDCDYKSIYCSSCGTGQYGRGAKRDANGKIYCARCLGSGSAA